MGFGTVALIQKYDSQLIERIGNITLITQLALQDQTAAVEVTGLNIIALLKGYPAQISQRHSHSPTISEGGEERDALLFECACARVISLVVAYIAHVVIVDSFPTTVACCTIDFERLLKQRISLIVMVVYLGNEAQVVEGAGGTSTIAGLARYLQ